MYPAAQDLKSTHEFLPVDARDSICLCFFFANRGEEEYAKGIVVIATAYKYAMVFSFIISVMSHGRIVVTIVKNWTCIFRY